MLFPSDIPSRNEWLAVLSLEPARAERLFRNLRALLNQQSLTTDPSIQISLNDYDQAWELLAASETDAAIAAQLPGLIARGQASLATPPTEAQWRELLRSDADVAEALAFELELKSARFGFTAPQVLLDSLKVFRSLVPK